MTAQQIFAQIQAIKSVMRAAIPAEPDDWQQIFGDWQRGPEWHAWYSSTEKIRSAMASSIAAWEQFAWATGAAPEGVDHYDWEGVWND